MTSLQYWTRWALAGALFLVALSLVDYFVVTQPIVQAIRGTGHR